MWCPFVAIRYTSPYICCILSDFGKDVLRLVRFWAPRERARSSHSNVYKRVKISKCESFHPSTVRRFAGNKQVRDVRDRETEGDWTHTEKKLPKIVHWKFGVSFLVCCFVVPFALFVIRANCSCVCSVSFYHRDSFALAASSNISKCSEMRFFFADELSSRKNLNYKNKSILATYIVCVRARARSLVRSISYV